MTFPTSSSITCALAILLLLSVPIFSQTGGASSPQAKNTDQKVDQNGKSVARVNPVTLAMELTLPMGSYTGRNGSSTPYGLNYSSKLWRMQSGSTYWYQLPYSYTRQYVTQLRPIFAERSAAGWTSTIAFPVIEEELELFDEGGKPFNITGDEESFNSLAEESFNSSGGTNNLTANLYACSFTCYDWGWGYRECFLNWCIEVGQGGGWGGGDGCSYDSTGSCPASCSTCSGDGGTWDDPGLPPVDDPVTPQRMHYVKRVHVRMGEGSTVEFRKSDAVFGYCAGGTSDGPNCEGDTGFVDNYGTFLSVDGSALKLERSAAGSTLYLPDGGKFFFPAASTGNYDRKALYQASEFQDPSGNRKTFQGTTVTAPTFANQQTYKSISDTVGRQIINPLPDNFGQQKQIEGIQTVDVPGPNGTEREYQLKWLHLKPVVCPEGVTENCGSPESALENQSENPYYYTANTCLGSYYGDLETTPGNPAGDYGENLFPLNGLGLRSCNPFTGATVQTIQGVRFNPVVLAEMELPNGKKYEFKYNQWGEITRVTHPTGMIETFTYGRILPLESADSGAYDQTNRGVSESRVYDAAGQLIQRWRYSAEHTSQGYRVSAIEASPSDPLGDGKKTERYIAAPGAADAPFGFRDLSAGSIREERVYAEGNHIVLRARMLTETILKGPTSSGDPSLFPHGTATRDPRVKRSISITIENGQALAVLSEKEYETPGENGSSAPTDPEYFAHLNVKRSKSHHFRNIPLSLAQTGTLEQIAAYFNSSSVAAISETDYLYDQNYMERGISSLPIETRSINPEDNSVQARTQTKYDNLVPNISTGYDYTVENYGISGYYDCGMVAPKKCWIDPASAYLGRPTTSRLWNKDENTWIETHTGYDIFGNVVKAKDPIGNESSTLFEDSPSKPYKFAYPTRLDTPAPDPTGTHGTDQGSFSATTYDFMTGLPLTVTNEFGQTTATEYNDPLLRPTRTYAVNFTAPESQTIYDDNARTVKVRKQIDAVNWDEATTFMDSLGRTIKTVAKDSQGDVIVETKYDFLGRVQMVTNPYRQGETVYWSLTEYDEAGRVKQTREPVANQNAAAPTGNILGVTSYDLSTLAPYLGTVITTTDAAGKKGRSITNALGQLIVVEEPDSDGNLTALPQGTPQPSPTPTPPIGGGDPPPSCLIPGPSCFASNPAQGEYPSYATYYRYDTLGKMVEVTQGVQRRWFKYDSLGRLIRVRQPEQEVNTALNLADPFNTSGEWTAGFTYDVLGNVLTATDANGTTITNTYDRAGRVKTRSYSGEPQGVTTPAVSFYYDGKGLTAPQTPNYAKGKLTKVTSSVSATEYQLFDNLGRMTQMAQITDGHTYTSKYTYNFAGALVEEEYPSGRKVKNEFESDGDISRIYGNATPTATERTYANTFSYTPDGRIEKLRLGNGLWEKAKFNSRLQVTEMAVGNGVNSGNLWKLGYEYGEIDTNGNVDTAKNTGNVARQTLSFNGLANPFVQTYKYDSLYRLTEARETSNGAQTWKQNFSFDRYGNRLTHDKFAGTTQLSLSVPEHPAIETATNRLSAGQGFTFDANGNLIIDADGRQFTFNGDNKQTVVRNLNITPPQQDPDANVIGRYFYDGEGKRIKKVSATETTVFVYSAGKLIAEYSTATPSNPTTSWTVTDQLGSPRVIVNSLGQVISRRDFMPFGEELDADETYRTTGQKYGQTDSVRQKFTGYQKDEETGLDFAEARMYQNLHGRFTAVDPLLASGKSANPQTFNRYVYVINNPLIYTDPSGLQVTSKPGDDVLPCGRNDTCNAAYDTKTKTVSVTGTLVDVVVNAVGDFIEASQSFIQNRIYAPALESERGQLGHANFTMAQNVLQMGQGNEEATDYVHSRLMGTMGPSLLDVLEETNAAMARAQFVNEVSFTVNSLFLTGTQGYVAGSNFGRSGSFFGSSSSFSRGFGGQRLFPASNNRANFGVYEVLAEVPISGTSRSAHRLAANNAFAHQLEGSAELRGSFNQLLGRDVLGHMNSGSGRNLLNPPNTVWHHPIDRPTMIQLLRGTEHRNPLLRPILHPGPNGTGGFATHFGRN